MNLFLKKVFIFLLIGFFPLSAIFISYIYLDPFKVLKPYKYYSNFRVITNREYISTEKFLHNRGKYAYNSFIFGSSRTIAFRASSWKSHLNSFDQPYYFDASAENINGIYTKIRFLDSLHQKISNAIILLDRDNTFAPRFDSTGHLYIRHPLLSGGNKLTFQYSFFKAYLHPQFLTSFCAYSFQNKYRPFMKYFISETGIIYDSVTNEVNLKELENEIKADSNKYYSKLKNTLYDRKGEMNDAVPKIMGQYSVMLDTICQIFKRNGTDYKVIITPVYDQVKFNEEDMSLLRKKFKDHLYDFAGKNYFTEDKGHYYEPNHFRPVVGDSILKIVYNSRANDRLYIQDSQ